MTEKERFERGRFAATSTGNLLGAARILSDPLDRTEDLAETQLPVLIAHGEFDEAWPPEWQADMARRLVDLGIAARYSVISGAAHSPNNEQPEALADLLAEFWASTTG